MTSDEAIAKLEQELINKGKSFSDEQRLILQTEGGIDLLAVAGSGKTFTMSNLIAKRILTGEIYDTSKVLCTTFSKFGATELEGRLNELLMKMNLRPVKVTTLHAVCFEVLRQFGYIPKKVLTEGEALKYLRDAAKQVNAGLGKMSQDDLTDLMDTISLQYNNLMSDAQLSSSPKWHLNISILDYASIRENFEQMKANNGCIDFDDMLRYVYDWLCVSKHAPVLEWIQAKYRWLFIDEFQDTSPIQLAIIKAILGDDKPNERLVVVGDDDQCIYEWRGTDPGILINICGMFDLTKRYLSTNYRCPDVVVKRAGLCVRNMGTREVKNMLSCKQGGHVEILDIDSDATTIFKNAVCRGSDIVATRVIDQLSGKEGVCPPRAICVLSRNNSTMRILANMMYARGIPIKGQKSMYMSTSREWATLKKLLKILEKGQMITDVSDIIWQIIPYASVNFGNIVGSVVVEYGCTLDWALEHILNACYADGVYAYSTSVQLITGDPALSGRGQASSKTISSFEYEVGSKGISATAIINVINALRDPDFEQAMYRLLVAYREAAAFSYKASSTKRYFFGVIEYFTALVARYKSNLPEFVNSTEQFELGNYAGDNRIELRTIHGAKGGEWDTVYILMDDNIEFPNIEYIYELLKRGIDIDSIDRYIDSERRLHYVAQTRASRRLYCVSAKKNVSLFMLESYDCDTKDKTTGEPLGGNAFIRARASNVTFNNSDDDVKCFEVEVQPKE